MKAANTGPRADNRDRSFSMQWKIVRYTVLSSGLVLLLTALLLNVLVMNWLEEEYDSGLLGKAQLLATLTKEFPQGLDLDFADEFMPEFEQAQDPSYFQVWRHDGSVFERSNSLMLPEQVEALENADSAGAIVEGQSPADLHKDPQTTAGVLFSSTVLPDGRPGRQVQMQFVPQIPEDEDRIWSRLEGQVPVTLVVAMDTVEIAGLKSTVALSSALFVSLSLVLIGIATRAVVNNGLDPLRELQIEIEKLGVDTLDRRVELAAPAQELEVVTAQVNSLMDRIEAGVAREQRFASDVAHELKTPVAELRVIAEVALAWPPSAEGATELSRDVLDAALQMHHLIDNLLTLARYSDGSLELASESVDVAIILKMTRTRLESSATTRNVAVVLNTAKPFRIASSETGLGLIVGNLFSNAVEYCPSGQTVLIRLEGSASEWSLVFSNPAPDLEPADISVMFDRLWRKSASRGSSQHSGLGLTMVKAYSRLLNLELKASLSVDNELSITLSGRGQHHIP